MTLLCGTARKPPPRFWCCPPTGHLRPCYRRLGSLFFLPLTLCGPEQSGVSEGLVSSALLLLFSPSCLLTGFTGWQASAVARASRFFLCGQVTSCNRAALGEVNASVPTFLKKQSSILSVSTLSQFFVFPGIDGTTCARHSEGRRRTVITLFLLQRSLLVILKLHIPL